MSSPRRTPSMDSDNNTRKRVCKACDRCRLKKAKCDGAHPCSRCKQDNTICVFGERKRNNDKVYPKGYVEMLEQQQAQLVAGLQELYRLLQKGHGWPGAPLQEAQGGHPLTHDILERLGVLHSVVDSESGCEGFEEDIDKIKRRLFRTDTVYAGNGTIHPRSRASTSSDSEPGFASSASSIQTPPSQPVQFNNPFMHNVAPPTPQSPIQPQGHLSSPVKDFPLVMPSIAHTELNPANLMRSPWTMFAPSMDESFPLFGYDRPVDMDGSLPFNGLSCATSSQFQMSDFTMHDVDFSDFVPS